MTKQLSELLNLSQEDTTLQQTQKFIRDNQSTITDVDAAISKIDAALPLVRDLEAGDAELDELAATATNRANDLFDLGMNVDPRFAGVIFQTASTVLGHAITAKTAKLDKKLRMIQLQINKAKLDHVIRRDGLNEEEPLEGQGMVLDRNELLKSILAGNKK